MHNNIMAAGSRDRPPMLATGRYAQWRSRFLRYIDTRPNEDSPAGPEHKQQSETAQEMWEAIERLQQGESLNIQDVKTNLFWEFGQFTSHDGETIESYYTRFYKMMNEMIRNNLTVATMQVNVQFLQQLQPEWSRFVTIVKQQHKLDEFSYHKLFDILKQYQKEVNELRAERMAKNANPLALVATAQTLQDPDAPDDVPFTALLFRSQPIICCHIPPSRSLDPTTFYMAKIQELEAHYSYMAKIQEVPNADSGTDAEPLEQVHYDTDHNVFANDLQHFEQSESISNTCAVETGDSNVIPDSPDMCDNDIQNDQHDVECDDERAALANLIANLKLDVDDNKKIQKQLKKANATLTQELTECKSILAETSRTLGESNSIRDSCLVALQNKQNEFERYKAFNDRTVDYDQLERKLNETLGLLAQKDIDIQEGLKVKAYEISVVQAKHDELVKQSLLTRSHYEGLVKEKTKVITDLKLKRHSSRLRSFQELFSNHGWRLQLARLFGGDMR
ncbi:hypothetical protein Tco_0481522 [Tanacetum coccineum]